MKLSVVQKICCAYWFVVYEAGIIKNSYLGFYVVFVRAFFVTIYRDISRNNQFLKILFKIQLLI
jgi:hypothetical protein